MSLRDLQPQATITAVLGPTNTGKTYRAIRRMLGHRTGMIGLPLRLLAREVYERVGSEVGKASVALITGEEKIIPEKPRYWICTTESMPQQLPVDFAAIDEIQLAGHRERGHTFTDRLLHMRGFHETWLLGADTMTGLVQELVPTAQIEQHPRLSKLSYGGVHSIAALPPRSAVVAFSVTAVYELAEKIRAKRGGAAVVMGALSPRTRNAQVAMYQSGEVPFLVATDAIGMGLNMDVEHVAFAALTKFDGRQLRPLESAEAAQIAGRAGRYRRDGTFGALSDVGPLSAELVQDIEQHRFPALRRLVWRNTELDLDNLESLVRSLKKPAPRRCFVPLEAGGDLDTLERLAERKEVRRLSQDRDGLRLLWEVASVPDFRNSLPEAHVNLLSQVFTQLRGPRGALDPDWVRSRIEQLDRLDGELEHLMTRIAWIRTWTYITHRSHWLTDAEAWAARARLVEDRLSDALHNQLTARFVNQRVVAIGREREQTGGLQIEVDAAGEVRAAGHLLGALHAFDFALAGEDEPDKSLLRAARGALGAVVQARLEEVLAAGDEDFAFDDQGVICAKGHPLGRLARGPALDQPQVLLHRHDLLDSAGRGRLHDRVVAFVRGWVGALLAPLDRVDEVHLKNAARAIRYHLREGLGLCWRRALGGELKSLTPMDRRNIARMDVRIGTTLVYVESMLKPDKVKDRALLYAAAHDLHPLPPLPTTGAVSILPPAGMTTGAGDWAFALGFVPAGPRAVRADLLERLLLKLRQLSQDGPFRTPPEMPSSLACSRAELHQMIEALGYPPTEDGGFAPKKPVRKPPPRGGPPRPGRDPSAPPKGGHPR
jgi:ATP-dependent RNA helicase SUPV3L1/SUV3